ncbi:hypothetical protein MAR_020589 [Mya arenaria]|uniref:Uncharacterized protein n=1 Tax=Mya arenaria TaxID=6604 RepID=A0ABY7E8D2_MYAAR|nr:hypothetical protein MAR_020451 [Mya arenaria]WAR05220.1 hypothetical protein MAR_020589 [Mya arenaria]
MASFTRSILILATIQSSMCQESGTALDMFECEFGVLKKLASLERETKRLLEENIVQTSAISDLKEQLKESI